MTNEERKRGLGEARRKALDYAREAEEARDVGHRAACIAQAEMWAMVAGALKDGDPSHDSVTGYPDPVITR